jgi:N-acetylglucosaminyl-diphospho-decaprenol L-rhamnosyltransferase
MEVTAAIVSWNTRELLLRCLSALAPEAQARRTDVWVVDNGSTDGSADAARAAAPWARVLEPGSNLGFGRAVNRVARESAGTWLLACNADTALEPGALEAMVRAGAAPRTACVAPRLLLPGGATQHSVHPLPTVPFTLAFNLGLGALSRRLAERWCLDGAWDPERGREVPWAIGACLLLRRDAFVAVGGFDERQWMYAEDLDLGWRLRVAGWSTRYEPAARVRHEAGAATGQAFGPAPAARFMTETYAVLARRRGRARALLTASLNLLGAALRLAWMAPLATTSRRWRASARLNQQWLEAHVRGIRGAVRPLRSPR